MAGDMSPRKYYRGMKDGQSSILMIYPDASDEARAELRDFIRVGEWLLAQGLKAPKLLAVDEGLASAQFEDLGAQSFGAALRGGHDGEELYALGCDVLKHIKGCPVPEGLPDYYDSKVHYNRRQLVEYYLPLKLGRVYTEEQMNSYLAAWDEVEKSLPPCPQIFQHMDFHLENLMWMPGEEGIKRCGLIDYQHAVVGPMPYDLVNLLEDARVDVPEDLRAAMIERYCEGMSGKEKDLFLSWYRVLATQFHCRVIGLFIMQAAANGRDDYLVHVERLQKYIAGAVDHPVLASLKAWIAQEGLDFTPIKDLNGGLIRESFESF